MRKTLFRFLAAIALVYAVAARGAVTVTVNGSSHTIPQTNEKGWGANVTAWIQAISANTLQPNGGSFTLTADTDFGANYGLKSLYFKSRALNPAASGSVRLGNAESIGWRNAANSDNLLLSVNSSNQLTYNGVVLASSTGPFLQDSLFAIFDEGDSTKKIAFQASGISTGTTRTITMPDANVNLGALTNSNIDASAAIARSKLATSTEYRILFNAESTGAVDDSVNLRWKPTSGYLIANGAMALGTTSDPDSKAMLDIVSTTKYVLLPRMTTAQSDAITSPTTGALVFDTTSNTLRYYDGSAWRKGISRDATEPLSNKSIDADSNTITNIENADIKSGAAIARDKTASGTAYRILANNSSGVMSENAAITASRAVVSDANGQLTHSTTTSTQIGYLDTLSSNAQTQLNTKVSSDAQARLAYLTVASDCTSSPCNMVVTSGEFSSVTRSSTGVYTINITAAKFSTAPSCTLTRVDSSAGRICQFTSAPSTTSFGITCFRTSDLTLQDAGFQIICAGAR